MRSPEEIKNGLELHYTAGRCKECPYTADSEFKKTCFQLVAKDAIDYITQLESRLAQAERERDDMMPFFIRGMKKYGCTTCEHYIPAAYTKECLGCGNSKLLHWKWNGVCPENTKEETDG